VMSNFNHSGVTQALKKRKLTSKLPMTSCCGQSGGAIFQTSRSSERSRDLRRPQNTATLGMIWWFGRKEGSW
jgi:hypothetical protein